MPVLFITEITKQVSDPFWEEQFPEKQFEIRNWLKTNIPGFISARRRIDGNTLYSEMIFQEPSDIESYLELSANQPLFVERQTHRNSQNITATRSTKSV